MLYIDVIKSRYKILEKSIEWETERKEWKGKENRAVEL